MLQKHYRHLEAIALEHEEVEEVADLTEPDVDRISKRAGALLDQFRDMVYPAGYNPEKSGTKRKVELLTACVILSTDYQFITASS